MKNILKIFPLVMCLCIMFGCTSSGASSTRTEQKPSNPAPPVKAAKKEDAKKTSNGRGRRASRVQIGPDTKGLKPTIKSGRHVAVGIRMQQSIFKDSDFTRSWFAGGSVSGSTFNDINLSSILFDGVNMAGATIEASNLTKLQINNGNYNGMKINGVLVSELLATYRNKYKDDPKRLKSQVIGRKRKAGTAQPESMVSTQTISSGKNYAKGASSGHSVFKNVDMSNSFFYDSNLTWSTFKGVDLSGVTIKKVNLTATKFERSNMTNVQLIDCNTAHVTIDGILVTNLILAHRRATGGSAKKSKGRSGR